MKKPLAFVAMPFGENHKIFYQEVIVPVLEQAGFLVQRADEIRRSDSFMDNVFSAINACQLVVGVIAEKAANVMFELGYAKNLGKSLILLAESKDKVPADIQHLNFMEYGKKDRDEALREFKLWVSNISDEREGGEKTVLVRGDILECVIDSAFYLQKTRPAPSKDEIMTAIRNRQPFRQHLLYITEEGLSSYLNLCGDPDYGYYAETSQLVSENKKEIIDKICMHSGCSEFDFISIGPGNGLKDAVLLEEFCRRVNGGEVVYYYPYDICSGMLLEAARAVINNKGLSTNKLKLKAIEADVEQLPNFKSVFDYRPEPNVFSLLGGLNIGGRGEVALLQAVRGMLSEKDSFLLEVRKLSSDGPALLKPRAKSGEPAAAMGHWDLNVRLDVSPLRYVGAKFDHDSLVYVESELPSDISGTKKIIGRLPKVEIGGRVHKNVDLFPIDYYDVDRLQEKLKAMNFEVLWRKDSINAALFLLASNARE